MKKVWILGIANLVGSGAAAFYYVFWVIKFPSVAFSWALPVLITMIVTLTAGIFTFRNKNVGWGFAGLSMIGAGIIYFLVLWYILSWA